MFYGDEGVGKLPKPERFKKRRVVFHQKNNVKAAQQNYSLAARKYGPLKKGCKVSMEDCRVLTHTMWHQV